LQKNKKNGSQCDSFQKLLLTLQTQGWEFSLRCRQPLAADIEEGKQAFTRLRIWKIRLKGERD
jgi:hypothetical protein